MKSIHLLLAILSTLLFGCQSHETQAGTPIVSVEIHNHSAQDLKNVVVKFGVHDCAWDTVYINGVMIYAFFPYPITPDAELHWDMDGRPHGQKLDLRKIYPAGKPGNLIIVITDEQAEVSFKEGSP